MGILGNLQTRLAKNNDDITYYERKIEEAPENKTEQISIRYFAGTEFFSDLDKFKAAVRGTITKGELYFVLRTEGGVLRSSALNIPPSRVISTEYALHVYSVNDDNKPSGGVTINGYDVTNNSKYIASGLNLPEDAKISTVYYHYKETKGRSLGNEEYDMDYFKNYSKELDMSVPADFDTDYGFYKVNVQKPNDRDGQEDIITPNGDIEKYRTTISRLEQENLSLESRIENISQYKELSLTNDITIKGADFVMPALDVFNGNNNTITFDADVAKKVLFANNKGSISNLVVKSGTIIDDLNTGRVVSSYDVVGGKYNLYSSTGAKQTIENSEENTKVDELYKSSLRGEFGMNVKTGEITKGSEFKVYSVNKYNVATDEIAHAYVNLSDNNGITAADGNYYLPVANTFYYVDDADAKDVLAKATQPNIVYLDGQTYKCNQAQISDVSNIKVYKQFTASEVKFDRNFSAGAQTAQTICLPFTISSDEIKSILGEGGKLLQFNKVEPNADGKTNTYWFQYMSENEPLRAYQPYVLLFGKDVNDAIFDGLTNVTFSESTAVQSALPQSKEAVGGSLFGTLVQQTASQIENGRYTVFGFQKGEFVKMTGAVNFKPTRAYVRVPNNTAAANAKSGVMRFLDEDGNEVEDGGTTGIDSVTGTETGAFAVSGNNGAISITTDKALNVNIYTVSGNLVKSATVEAGSVSIPVASGMYIVNGKKVIVK